MNQGLIYLGVPLLMYVLQGVLVYYRAGRYGMALAFFSYALANAGFILDLFWI